jgi:O-antigen ligase
MPEHLRALIVILVLATTVFAFAHRPACAIAKTGDYTRRRNLWFAFTLAAFLAHNFWLYTLIAIPLLIYANWRETNPPALFFFILFALPIATISSPGMGLVNYLFALSHARILELLILLPAFFVLIRQRGTLAFGRTGPDVLLAAYILLTIVLYLRETTVTDTLRKTFYLFIDVFLPYFVISRSLKDLQAFRDALLSIVMAIMVVALVAVFETAKHWQLYYSLLGVLGLGEEYSQYLSRAGALRAVATAGQPIALGYLIATGMGLYLFLQRSIRNKLVRGLGMMLLAAGLIASLSRGPWVGAAVLLAVFIATGRHAVPRLLSLTVAAILTLSMIAMLPGGDKVIDILPFIGKTEIEHVEHRQKLLDISMMLINRNPWFGSVDFLNMPELQAMRTGLGIVDILNTYIRVGLESGFVGLGLFVSFFVLTLLGIYRAMRTIPDKGSDERLLGRALLATLVAILLIIFTVSSITIIPIVYWSVAGLGVAYAQMVRKQAAGRAKLARSHGLPVKQQPPSLRTRRGSH